MSLFSELHSTPCFIPLRIQFRFFLIPAQLRTLRYRRLYLSVYSTKENSYLAWSTVFLNNRFVSSFCRRMYMARAPRGGAGAPASLPIPASSPVRLLWAAILRNTAAMLAQMQDMVVAQMWQRFHPTPATRPRSICNRLWTRHGKFRLCADIDRSLEGKSLSLAAFLGLDVKPQSSCVREYPLARLKAAMAALFRLRVYSVGAWAGEVAELASRRTRAEHTLLRVLPAGTAREAYFRLFRRGGCGLCDLGSTPRKGRRRVRHPCGDCSLLQPNLHLASRERRGTSMALSGRVVARADWQGVLHRRSCLCRGLRGGGSNSEPLCGTRRRWLLQTSFPRYPGLVEPPGAHLALPPAVEPVKDTQDEHSEQNEEGQVRGFVESRSGNVADHLDEE